MTRGGPPKFLTTAMNHGAGLDDKKKQILKDTRPGKQTVCYWKWPFIVDLPIKNVIFHSYVSLPEGNTL